MVAPDLRPDAPELSDMNRREMLSLLTLAGLYVGAQSPVAALDYERLDYAAAYSGRLDSTTLAEYFELNNHLWRIFVLSKSKATAFPLVRQQLDVLTEAVQHSPGSDHHLKLCELIGDLAQLAGEILFDGNQYADAAQCYSLAASASKEAGAFDLWACAVVRSAFIGVYERKFQQTAPLLDLAASIAGRGDSALSTRQWVSAVQAQALAGLGDLNACQTALGHAASVRQLTEPSHNGGWLRFDGSRLAEEQGACYTALKRPGLAEHALTDALRQNLSSRRHGSVLVDLAAICAQRRDIDQLVVHATAALNIARRTGSGVVARKLQLLQPALLPLC
jgi:tetratricopeptide (TPR) repeat protein